MLSISLSVRYLFRGAGPLEVGGVGSVEGVGAGDVGGGRVEGSGDAGSDVVRGDGADGAGGAATVDVGGRGESVGGVMGTVSGSGRLSSNVVSSRGEWLCGESGRTFNGSSSLATPLQLKKNISNRKDLKVSLRPESTLPVLTLVDFRQWEQYQIKLSFDFVEEQGVSTIAVEQVEQVMLDFRIPRCWRNLIEESAVEVKL